MSGRICSYNAINGTAVCGDQWLNVDVVRGAWNFSGVIESDCDGISGISHHGNAVGKGGAALAAVRATIDVECDNAYNGNLLTLYRIGAVRRAQLAAAAARVFKGRFQIGEFDATPAVPAPWDNLTSDAVFSEAHQQLSLEGAQQSAVLLRNPNGLLPLKRGQTLAVIGPFADSPRVWQGNYYTTHCPSSAVSASQNLDADPEHKTAYSNANNDCLPTALSAITAANVGGRTVAPAGGCILSNEKIDGPDLLHQSGVNCATLVNMSAVLTAAREADIVVLFLGLANEWTNEEGNDRTGYALPGQQQELARQIAALRKPTIVILLSGMATGMDFVAAQREWSLLIPGYGGRFGPAALAQMLFGEVSPTGRLAYTIYPEKWAKNTPMMDMALSAGDGRTYKWYDGAIPAPFQFGEGMTYTSFSTTVVVVDNAIHESKNNATYTATIVNTGNFAAAQTVLLFARTVDAPTAPRPLPNRQLFDFGRTRTLNPGDFQILTFTVGADAVALVDWDGRRKAYTGAYDIEFRTGDREPVATKRFNIAQTITLSTLPPPRENRGFSASIIGAIVKWATVAAYIAMGLVVLISIFAAVGFAGARFFKSQIRDAFQGQMRYEKVSKENRNRCELTELGTTTPGTRQQQEQ